MDFGIYTCTFEIEVDGVLRKQRMQAPRPILEDQFMSLIQQTYGRTESVRVKIGMDVPVWSQIDGQWLCRENSITYYNPSYLKAHKM